MGEEVSAVTLEQIRTAIQAESSLLSLAQALVPDEAAIAAALPPVVTLREEYITERGVVAALGLIEGEAFLTALETFAATPLAIDHPLEPYQPGIARQLTWLKTAGLDVGSAPARELLDTLAAVGVIQAAHAATIKALAETVTPISPLMVRRAIFNDDGSRAV